ncbi:cation:proton antiporter [Streptomyces gibsoniae]|uniref:Cation:proton antiporter n=1 Tax=Streptomyces gibsoniae TaxID=3075529 RepID=A0ABU2TU79_9ACTN|nr:cation:proton antiporter [Streptomyces sp. DSM 41699]MDT0464471.1 cation:proton antiporter [Streptomyces sp. DSM 41699]
MQPALKGATPSPTASDEGRSAVRRRLLGYGLLVALPLLTAALLLLLVPDGGRRAVDAGLTSDNHAAAALLLAMAVVVGGARLAGLLAVRLGQPQVVGEIVMGVALGPTLLARIAPTGFAWLFPPGVIGGINTLAQLGLVLFMFGTGREAVRSSGDRVGRDGALIALTSLIVPFTAGIAVGLSLAGRFAGAAADSVTFALFVGCALSITAFPVLARVLTDLRMTGGRTGRLSLFAAALGDGVCWILLTVVLLLAQGDGMATLWRSVLLSLVAAGFILWPVRLVLARVLRSDAGLSTSLTLTIAVVGTAASSGLTALLGIHQLIGAFLFGLAWPVDPPHESRLGPSLDTMAHLLLPFFFLGFGLSVDLGDLPFTAGSLGVMGLLLVTAVLTKVCGVALAARFSGMDRKESATMGLLMNARGLTELVVLGIGHDSGLIDGRMFAILTVVALLTTLMTGPAVRRLGAAAEPAR